jgi:hypothetical protein
MKPPARSEHDEQVALFEMIRLYKQSTHRLKTAFAIPNGGLRHKAVAAKLKAEGVSAQVIRTLPWIGRPETTTACVLSLNGTARGLACQAIRSNGLQGLVMRATFVSAVMAGVMRGLLFAGILKLIRKKRRGASSNAPAVR